MALNTRARYSDIHRSGYDSSYRIADQNRDGVSCEVIYPSVGMVLCNHPDFDYKKAAMDAYNRWIAEYCSVDPQRLLALGPDADALARGGHHRRREDEGDGHARRDDVRATPRSRTTTRRSTTSSGRPASTSSWCRRSTS